MLKINPFILNYSPVLPTAFDDSLSYYEQLSKIQLAINEIVAGVNQIESDLTNKINSNYTELKNDLANLDQKFTNKLQTAVTELNNTIDALETELKTDISNLDNKFTAEISNVRSELNAAVTQINESITNLNETLTQKINSEVSRLDNKIDETTENFTNITTGLGNRLNAAEADIQKNANDIATNTANIENNKTEIDEIREDLDGATGVNAQLQNLNTRVTANEKNIDDDHNEIEILKNTVFDNAGSGTTGLVTRVTNLETSQNEQDTKIAEIEDKIDHNIEPRLSGVQTQIYGNEAAGVKGINPQLVELNNTVYGTVASPENGLVAKVEKNSEDIAKLNSDIYGDSTADPPTAGIKNQV